MIISDQRSYFKRSPGLICATRWLAERYNKAKTDTTIDETERQKQLYYFSPVDQDKIWVENAVPTTSNDGNCLVCFGIRDRGYVVLDAVCKIITFTDLISYYKVPVKQFATYAELITFMQTNRTPLLVKVAESTDGKYGLIDDNTITNEKTRYQSLCKALGDVQVNMVTNYQSKTFSATQHVVGTVAISHGSLVTEVLELYPLGDVKV